MTGDAKLTTSGPPPVHKPLIVRSRIVMRRVVGYWLILYLVVEF